MKKIFALMLTALLFAACGDDDTEPAPKPYYNPIEGQWESYPNDGKNKIIRKFSKKFELYSYVYQNNKFVGKEYIGKYTITSSQIAIPQLETITYSIANDTLYITTSVQKQKWVRNNEILPE